ncbi:MAG: hypothetical protein LQ352_008361 [Teloschistes flavicans]|nr:MAG: hypothetical protein LQ352_008361 [Teloschistes flavicans]
MPSALTFSRLLSRRVGDVAHFLSLWLVVLLAVNGTPIIPVLSHNHTTPLSETALQCVDSETWRAPYFFKEDCYVAVQNLYKWDFRFHPDVLFTFYAGGQRPAHSAQLVRTPKRYTESTCTLALVNLNMVNPMGLPGSLPHGREGVDKTTFREIYDVARTLEDRCVLNGGTAGRLGWAPVGEPNFDWMPKITPGDGQMSG